MAYDEQLANRIRRAFSTRQGVSERKMFGGLAFLFRGRMCCGIVGRDLMVRIPDDEFEAVIDSPHVRPMDFTGKPLKGFVYVSPSGFRTPTALRPGSRMANKLPRRRQRRPPRGGRAL